MLYTDIPEIESPYKLHVSSIPALIVTFIFLNMLS